MRLVLLPGLGVGPRLFDAQRILPVPFAVPDWVDPRPTDTLEAYADRMADRVGPCDALGGVSFGGMVAQAMAARLKPKIVIGIATARRGKDIPGALRWAESLVETIPIAGPGGALLAKFLGNLPRRFHTLVISMIQEARLDVVREGARMAVAWKGAEPVCPVRLIHGALDVVIRAPSVKPDKVVRGGGHLINVTHPKVVNDFIMESLQSVNPATRE